MTNITPEQRLALARAVYPDKAVTDDTFGLRVWHGGIGGAAPVLFEPESNPAQLLDVLCWLIQADEGHDTYAPDFYNNGIQSAGEFFPHNCTPASLSDAIVRAAVRVREGE